jgi:hypothetical protein
MERMSEKAYFELSRTFTSSQSNIVRVLAPVTGNLVRAFVRSDTAMDGGSALFDVNKNGTTIFGDPDDRLKILDTENNGDAASLAIAVTQYTDVITVDLDGFTGTAAAVGGKLTLVLEFEESGGGGGAVVFAKFTKDTSQEIEDAGAFPAALDWNIAGDDDSGFFDETHFGDLGLATVPDRLGGLYFIQAQVRWEGNASGVRWLDIAVDKYDSGPTGDFIETVIVGAFRAVSLGNTAPHYMQVSATFRLEEGWVVSARVWQNSGSPLDVQPGAADNETWFTITRLG